MGTNSGVPCCITGPKSSNNTLSTPLTATTGCSTVSVDLFLDPLETPNSMTRRPIKFTLGALALFGFLVVVLFWWTGPHIMGSDHLCVAAAVQNEDCPSALTAEAVIFHLETIQELTANGLQLWQISGILFALILIVLAFTHVVGGMARRCRVARREILVVSSPRKYQHWLSLFEHSPSLFSLTR